MRIKLGPAVAVVFLCLLVSVGFAQQSNSSSPNVNESETKSQEPAATLVLGSTLEASIVPGSDLLYRVPLTAGEYARFEITTGADRFQMG